MEGVTMLIAICGIDGAGKTTQIELLREELEKKREVYLTKQPTDFYRNYERFRKYVDYNIDKESEILYELALLSAADRMKHYNEEIKANKDKIIISDRYVFSSYAYFMGRGLEDIAWLKEINKYSPMPNLTFYLDITPEKAVQRIYYRDGISHKKEETDMQVMERVRNFFLKQPWGDQDTYYVIKADTGAEQVHEEIMDVIRKACCFE